MRKIFLLYLLVFITLACNTITPSPTATATQSPSTPTPPVPVNIPQTSDDVLRVSVKDAKAASDSGEAIIVDVRSAAAFAAEHISGAINIPLADIEANPAGVKLDKNQWIITYCT